LGYTLSPNEKYNLTTEQKNLSDSKKADGAVFKDSKVIAVIELKSTKTKNMQSFVNQAFNYKNDHPTCKYIITSNFEKLRFYVEHSDKYEALRVSLFENIIKNNSHIDKLIFLEKTQKLLDRMVFVFFAEDRGILPTNTIQAINKGNSKLNIDEYNGGLFANDELLDALVIDNEVINACPLALSAYDFNSDIDVNILGHIFENSLNDIEEMKAKIDNEDFYANLKVMKKNYLYKKLN